MKYSITVGFILFFLLISPFSVIAQVINRNGVNATPFLAGSWNMPASQLAVDSSRQNWVSYLYNNGTAARPGNFNLGWREYTYPIYIATASTPKYVVSSDGPINGKTMPYDPAWQVSLGSDAQIIVIDPTTERYYDLWQVQGIVNGKVQASNGSVIENYRSATGINMPSRGCGIAYLAMLITPEEVESGVILHALSMTTENTGPSYVAPAIKSDGGTFGVSNGVPMGTRFALTMTNAQLDTWVASKPANLQTLAHAIGYALRDYGWVITDSSGGATVQMEDYHTAGDAWTRITGISNISQSNTSIQDLLDGLDWMGANVLEARSLSSDPIPTTNPTAHITATPQPNPTPIIIPSYPAWWNQIPPNLRNFLEQLYVLVYYFQRTSNMQYLLEGVFPTPTP